jgi:hypothetical protein
MTVDDKICLVTVLLPFHKIRHLTERSDVARLEKRDPVFEREPLAGPGFFPDGQERLVEKSYALYDQ